MNLVQHCLAVVLSWTAHCCCFWGFSHALTVTVEGLSNTTQLTSHNELQLCYKAVAHLCTHCRDRSNACNCAHIHILVSTSRIGLHFPICGSRETQVEENWNGLRNNEQSKQDFKWKIFQTRVPSAFTLGP